MPDRKRIAEYFLVVGLPPENPQPLEPSLMQDDEDDDDPRYENGALRLEPITDIAVVNGHEYELPPRGFQMIKTTPMGFEADLNNDSFNSPAMYLCIKRGRDKPPLTEIGVFYHPKEGSPPHGHEVLRKTPYGRSANVSNSSIIEIYLTYKRASPTAAANCPVVTDICVILGNKDESPPQAFVKIDKSLNRGLLSFPVFVCYKSSRVRHHQLAYTGSILSRYPITNYPECPLSESVPLFSLPTGAVLEAWPARNELPEPECSTFVLTDAEGVRLYGSSLSFYEPYDRSRLTTKQCDDLELDLEAHRKLDLRVFSNKAIVIISLFPFFDAFKKFLHFLHARIHQDTGADNGAVPLEKYVLHFLHEVPCPSPQVPNIELSLNDATITLRMIEDTMNISQGGASFVYLLSDLGAENAISLLMYTLTEQKLLVHSLRQDRLTRVCEAIISIIFPLQWQCPYIPLCPLALSGLSGSPVPFIYGFDSRYFDYRRRPPDDVICVDLDAKLLHVPQDRKWVASKMLPKRPLKVLRTSLEERLVKIREFEQRKARNQTGSLALNRLENDIETSIKECFLRFMACLLRDYRHYLVPIQPNTPQIHATDSFSLFNVDAYQKSKDRSYHKFYSAILGTQMFSRFIEENSLGSSGRDEMLAFFESCTQMVDESRDTPPLLERDKALVSEHTKLVLPPEGPDPGRVFEYKGVFPCLDQDLMRVLQTSESSLLSEGGDADSGIATSTSGVPQTSSIRDSSSAPPDDSSPGPLESGPSTAAGTPRIGHRNLAITECPTGSGQKPCWLRIKHEQTITNRIGRITLNSKSRDKVWPYHLLSATYCLWFPIIPAYLNFLSTRRGSLSPQDQNAPMMEMTMEHEYLLRYALELLKRMVYYRVIPTDQVCYRVLLHMAAVYRLPQFAMDVLAGMQYGGVQANAVTYALYNQVLLELGVVSDAMDNKSDSVSVHTGGEKDFRSAMKRSHSDDGQLDSVRTPRRPSGTLRGDADTQRVNGEDGGYGTLRDGMDTAMTEIRHFVKEHSSRALHYQKVVRTRFVASIWTMVSSKSQEEQEDDSQQSDEKQLDKSDYSRLLPTSPSDPFGELEFSEQSNHLQSPMEPLNASEHSKESNDSPGPLQEECQPAGDHQRPSTDPLGVRELSQLVSDPKSPSTDLFSVQELSQPSGDLQTSSTDPPCVLGQCQPTSDPQSQTTDSLSVQEQCQPTSDPQSQTTDSLSVQEQCQPTGDSQSPSTDLHGVQEQCQPPSDPLSQTTDFLSVQEQHQPSGDLQTSSTDPPCVQEQCQATSDPQSPSTDLLGVQEQCQPTGDPKSPSTVDSSATDTNADSDKTGKDNVDEVDSKKNDSPKTLPIIRRPKRPSIIRNRSLTGEDRRPSHINTSERSREDSVEAGLLSSLTPTPGEDAVFELPPSNRATAAPVAESTPLAIDVAIKRDDSVDHGDPDRTPMASVSNQSDLGTPTPQSVSEKSSSSPRRGPTKNLASLWEEKSELHISFMGASPKGEKERGVRRASRGASGSTYSVDSRISTETEEDLDEDYIEEEEVEDWSGLATFYHMARQVGLTTQSRSAKSGQAVAQRSSTLSLPQGAGASSGQAGEVDAASMTSRGSADNALSVVSNFKRNASIRMKDVASRFSQRMASVRQQLNNASGYASPQQTPGLNRSTGELRSNSFGSAAAVTSSWLSTSVRRLKASQDSSVGLGAGSLGEDSEDEDSDCSDSTYNIRDIWKLLSGVGTSPSPSQQSSHRPSVTSTPTSPTEERQTIRPPDQPPVVTIRLSSCSPCVQCRALIYDEDIMNRWTYEGSNYNTICPYCHHPTLPRLSISLTVDDEEETKETYSCLYLSPLALRKVMETVFMESPDCMQQIGVIDAHPELFWNCLWYLTRLQLPHHLVYLVGLWWSQKTNRTQMCRVRVELKWDSWLVDNRSAGLKPLYRLWADKCKCDDDDPKYPIVKHLERILNCIKTSDMKTAMDLFLEARHAKITDRSAYRDILYLSMQALGRKNIDTESFTYFYAEAHKALVERGRRERPIEPCDKLPARGATWCRTLFPVLEL